MDILTWMMEALFTTLQYGNIELCQDHWTASDLTGLGRVLDAQLHGQHLVKSVILPAVRNHIYDTNPHKALVLSLHGQVGVGKSFVAGMIVDHLYLNGFKSRFVHKKVGSHHYGHSDRLWAYKEDLKNWVKQGVRACERSLFIIEETHEVPGGVLDVLKPYLDHHAIIDGVDYRKAIFIFASNTGDEEINKYALRHWEAGGKREDIAHKDMDDLLSKAVFNIDGGLWRSSLIRRKMVTAFVGFLPLERHHVILCARDEANNKRIRYTSQELEGVANDITYFPREKPLFSTYGCKGVADAVARVLDY